MKILFSFLIGALLLNNDPTWLIDFNQAKTEASKSGKHILVNFSGSDWCAPCIRMHKELFEASAFTSYAQKNLVLVNADFPRMKKNQLSKEQQKRNETLADRYNPKGIFPLTVLTDANGKAVRSWEGYPNENAEKFIAEVNAIVNGQ